MVHCLIIAGFLLHILDGAWIYCLKIEVKSGSPGIFPCLYEEKYKEFRKYWCHGRLWSSCSVMAYANETTNTFSVTDYPAQSVFTVEWQDLQPSDSGYYWCAVEIGGVGTLDDSYRLYLTVQSAPRVSVMSSRVSGHQGDDISVQCFYSSEFQNKPKSWCRYNDRRCFKEKKTGTSPNSSVQISDDGNSSFTVVMTGLRLSDSGWYYCSVGDLQVPVLLIVTNPKPKATTPETEISTTQPSTSRNPIIISTIINETALTTDSKAEAYEYDGILITCLVAILVLLVLALVAISRRLRKKPVCGRIREENGNSTSNNVTYGDLMISSSPAEANPLSSVDPEAYVIYSAVKINS